MSSMRRALSLARRSLGGVSPNPSVGAVVVNGGAVVGEGRTEPPGGRHAEVVALEQAGEAARGGVMYVSLEPCNHHGRTPPCVDAILEAGIAEVHAAISDPNPSVAGGGAAALRDAGVKVVVGERAAEASTLLEAYLKWVTTRRPFVTAKFAMSLDGKIATRSGDSQWITGERARQHVHELRAASDAVMVGVGTVLADDPLLTARDRTGRPLARQPLRVVVDTRGRTPLRRQAVQPAGAGRRCHGREPRGRRGRDGCPGWAHRRRRPRPGSSNTSARSATSPACSWKVARRCTDRCSTWTGSTRSWPSSLRRSSAGTRLRRQSAGSAWA